MPSPVVSNYWPTLSLWWKYGHLQLHAVEKMDKWVRKHEDKVGPSQYSSSATECDLDTVCVPNYFDGFRKSGRLCWLHVACPAGGHSTLSSNVGDQELCYRTIGLSNQGVFCASVFPHSCMPTHQNLSGWVRSVPEVKQTTTTRGGNFIRNDASLVTLLYFVCIHVHRQIQVHVRERKCNCEIIFLVKSIHAKLQPLRTWAVVLATVSSPSVSSVVVLQIEMTLVRSVHTCGSALCTPMHLAVHCVKETCLMREVIDAMKPKRNWGGGGGRWGCLGSIHINEIARCRWRWWRWWYVLHVDGLMDGAVNGPNRMGRKGSWSNT